MGNFKTPLRYPGGKQRLSPFINELLSANDINGHYVEPYAGGAGVAMELLLSRKVDYVHLNDSYLGIYAFWHTIIHHHEKLCAKILSASLTVDEWKLRRGIVRRCDSSDLFELGYSIFYINRCNRSGMLSGGLIGGLDQTGNYKMDARFNRDDLVRRIEAIAIFSDRISLTNMDAEDYILNYIPNLPSNALVYLDPPYYNKASDLYLNSYKKEDHQELSKVIQEKIQHRWVLSYDGVNEILGLYNERRHFLYDLQYTAAKVYKGKEVFIFGDTMKLPTECSMPNVLVGLENLILPDTARL
jgi:DNA adenine methylase